MNKRKTIRNKNTEPDKLTARIVGILYIIATATGILSVVFLISVLNNTEDLVAISRNSSQIVGGALLDLVGAGAFVALAVVIFPILKRHSERTAVGYLVARSFEAVPFIIANISLLAILSLSQEYVLSATPDDSSFLVLSNSLRSVYDWCQLLGPRILASLAALPLYLLLYQTNLVPRWISVWGLIGTPLYFASGLIPMLGLLDSSSPILVAFFIPIALLEMVFALWLIFKGFNSSVSDPTFGNKVDE